MRNNIYSQRKKSSRSRKKILLGVGLGVLVIIGVLFILEKKDIINLPFIGKDPETTSSDDINYAPPTEQDKQENDQLKENLGDTNKPGNSSTTTSSGQAVTPTIVDATQYGNDIEVRAFIPGIVEEGGTCTVTLTKGAESIKRDSAGIANTSDTQCSAFVIPRSAFSSAGDWSAVVSYKSGAHQGSSTTKVVKVQ